MNHNSSIQLNLTETCSQHHLEFINPEAHDAPLKIMNTDLRSPSYLYICPLCIAHAIQSRNNELLEHLLAQNLPIHDSFLVLTSQCIAREADLESLIPRVSDPEESEGFVNNNSINMACGHHLIDPELLDPNALDWCPGAPFLVNVVQLAVHLSDSQFDALTPLCRRFPALTCEMLAFHEIRPVDELIELQGSIVPGVLMAHLSEAGVQRRVRVTTKFSNLVGLLTLRRPMDSVIVSRLLDNDLIDLNWPILCITMQRDEDATDDPSDEDTFQQSFNNEDTFPRNGVVTGREAAVLLDMSQQMLSNPTSSNYLHRMADGLQMLIRLGCDINNPLDEILFYVASKFKMSFRSSKRMGVLHAFVLRAWRSLPSWFAFHLLRILLSNGLSHFVCYVPESRVESSSAHCSRGAPPPSSPPPRNRLHYAGCAASCTTAKAGERTKRPTPKSSTPLLVDLFSVHTGVQNLRATGRIARQLIALCYALPEFGDDDKMLSDTLKWIECESTSTNQLSLHRAHAFSQLKSLAEQFGRKPRSLQQLARATVRRAVGGVCFRERTTQLATRLPPAIMHYLVDADEELCCRVDLSDLCKN